MKDKLKRKKYMGVCRCEFSQTKIIKPRFPITVMVYIPRNRTEKGSWRSGWSVNPTKKNGVKKDPFSGAILL